jgi:hypothetical protein
VVGDSVFDLQNYADKWQEAMSLLQQNMLVQGGHN